MSQRPLGFGIWGTGMIAEFHAKALAEIADVKLVAAYNRSPAKGRDFTARHGITFAETPEQLLSQPSGGHRLPLHAERRSPRSGPRLCQGRQACRRRETP
jgi:hypothetical protein